jgi:hypothetical protein
VVIDAKVNGILGVPFIAFAPFVGGIKSISIITDGERYEPGQKFSQDEYPKYVSSS